MSSRVADPEASSVDHSANSLTISRLRLRTYCASKFAIRGFSESLRTSAHELEDTSAPAGALASQRRDRQQAPGL